MSKTLDEQFEDWAKSYTDYSDGPREVARQAFLAGAAAERASALEIINTVRGEPLAAWGGERTFRDGCNLIEHGIRQREGEQR